VPLQKWLHGSLCDKGRLRAALSEAALIRLDAEVGSQDDPEHQHRQKADRSVDREQPRR
jgi:hypothetical protein